MTNWMDSTLAAPSEGGRTMLPEGVGNFTISDARIEVNRFNGRNEAVLRLAGERGGGQHTIPLEPWSADAIDTFLRIFNNSLGNIGVPVEGRTAKQVLEQLPNTLAATIGNVVEMNVIHEDQKPKPDGSHLKEDGTPWKNQKAYLNRLVSEKGAATGGPMAALDAAFAAAPSAPANDDIPF